MPKSFNIVWRPCYSSAVIGLTHMHIKGHTHLSKLMKTNMAHVNLHKTNIHTNINTHTHTGKRLKDNKEKETGLEAH